MGGRCSLSCHWQLHLVVRHPNSVRAGSLVGSSLVVCGIDLFLPILGSDADRTLQGGKQDIAVAASWDFEVDV